MLELSLPGGPAYTREGMIWTCCRGERSRETIAGLYALIAAIGRTSGGRSTYMTMQSLEVVMRFVAGYIAFLVAFGICDAIWLTAMAQKLYRPALGDMLLEQIRYLPAILFYLGFSLGVVHFALMPALREGSGNSALVNGALVGLLAYATYDLTNYATLRAWTLTITLADMAYGAIVVGLCSWVAYIAVRQMEAWGWI